MNRPLRIAAASLAVLLLAACGAKGPLFLPTQEPPVETVEPASDVPTEGADGAEAVETDANTGTDTTTDTDAKSDAETDTPPADSSTPPVTPAPATATGKP